MHQMSLRYIVGMCIVGGGLLLAGGLFHLRLSGQIRVAEGQEEAVVETRVIETIVRTVWLPVVIMGCVVATMAVGLLGAAQALRRQLSQITTSQDKSKGGVQPERLQLMSRPKSFGRMLAVILVAAWLVFGVWHTGSTIESRLEQEGLSPNFVALLKYSAKALVTWAAIIIGLALAAGFATRGELRTVDACLRRLGPDITRPTHGKG